MPEECKALILYESPEEKLRRELETALRKGKVADPFTIAGITITVGMQIQAAMLAASLAISYALSRAASSRTPPQQLGKLSGSLQIQNSAQGIFIPEIYGAGPQVSLVAGSDPTWTSGANSTTAGSGRIYKSAGADEVWNSGAVHNTTVGATDEAFVEAIFDISTTTFSASAIGFSVDDSPESGAGVGGVPALEFGVVVGGNVSGQDSIGNPIVSNTYQAIVSGVRVGNGGTWASGDTFRVEKRKVGTDYIYKLYHDYAEITDFTPPSPTSTVYLSFSGWRTNFGVVSSKVQINNIGDQPSAGSGGCKVPAIIVWTSQIRKQMSTSQQSVGGKGGIMGAPSTTVQTTTYDVDIGLMYCRGPVSLVREYGNTDVIISRDPNVDIPTGSFDPTVGSDGVYTFGTLPDPQLPYPVSLNRNNREIEEDPGGGDGGSGTTQGGTSGFAIYPGDYIQLEDPTIQADVDGEFGAESTPAYRGRSLVVHTAFSLTKFSGLLPNFVAVWQHKTLKTLDDIFASFFPRVNLSSSNYDFTNIDISCRGLLIAGRQFTPAEIMDNAEMYAAYDYFITEGEGKIWGYTNGTEPTLTIDESEVGWLDAEGQIPDIVETITGIIPEETSLEKEIDFKYIDPGFDWDSNVQIAQRRVTDRVSVNAVELHCTLTPDEAKAAAQRMLYFNDVSSVTRSFTLPWTYMYIYPGYRIIINGNDGYTYTLRLTDVQGGVGILSCEAFTIDPAIFDQSSVTAVGSTVSPKSIMPAMTVMLLWDGPILRDSDEQYNSTGGIYAAGTKRTSSANLSWLGNAFYVERNTWEVLGAAEAPATLGKVISASTINGSDPTSFNMAASVTVDLYGDTATLESVSQAEITSEGKNLAVMGGLAFHFTTATQVGGYPNRWTLGGGMLLGVRDTDEHLIDTFTDTAFLLVNGAVKFLPMTLADIDATYNYRAVTVGQSLDDAATVEFNYQANSLRPAKVTDINVFRDASLDFLIQFTGHPTLIQIPETYVVEIWEDATRDNPANLKRTLPVTVGTTHACLLISSSDSLTDPTDDDLIIVSSHAHKNNLISDLVPILIATRAYTVEAIERTYSRFDFTIQNSSGYDSTNDPNGFDTGFVNSPAVVVGLQIKSTVGDYPGTLPDLTQCPLSVEWVVGTIYGTVKEIYRSFNVQIATRDNIDPGYGGSAFSNPPYDIPVRRGPRYTFLLSGSEYRAYVNYNPSAANTPIAIVAAPSGGFPFPLRLTMRCESPDYHTFGVRNITSAGNVLPTTIYSSRDQIEDFGIARSRIYGRIYQVDPLVGSGFPVDFVAPSLPFMIAPLQLEGTGTVA